MAGSGRDSGGRWPLAAMGGTVALCVVAGCGKDYSSGFGGAGGSGGSTTSSTSSASGGTTSTTTSSTSGSGGQGHAGEGPGGEGGAGGGPVPLSCDPGWDFVPDPPTAGSSFQVVYFTDVAGSWVYVDFEVAGAGAPQVSAPEVIGGQPPYQGYYAWRATVSGHQPGQLDLSFWENCDGTCDFVSACSILVEPAAQ